MPCQKDSSGHASLRELTIQKKKTNLLARSKNMSYQSHNGIAQRVQQTLHPTSSNIKNREKEEIIPSCLPFLFVFFLLVVTN